MTDVLSRAAPPPDRTIRYGEGPDHVIDLRLPANAEGARPLVVVVHGGFWRSAYDREHTGPQASALAEAGHVVAVPEYGRVGSPGGGWPGTFEDTARWSDAVVDLVCTELGEDVVDRERVVLVGHSAGGHLALWAAARHRLPETSPWRRSEPLPVRGVVALAGVADIELAATLRLSNGATQDLLGGEPTQVPARYAEADPALLLPTGIPTVLVHGDSDEAVPIALSRSYAQRARMAGDAPAVDELPATGHFELIDPLTPAWTRVVGALDRLLT